MIQYDLGSAQLEGLEEFMGRLRASGLASDAHASGELEFVSQGSRHNSLKRWEPLLDIRPGRGAVMGFAFNPDGSRLMTGSLDGAVQIWESTQRGGS